MKKTIMMMGFAGLFLISLSGCQKDPLKNLNGSDARIYITNRDSVANFSNFLTFSIADSAGVIEDNQGKGMELTDYDARVIDAVRARMQERGYQLVDRSQQPDIGITVSRVYSNYTGVVSYPSYWDYYGSYYDPFYWGYGGFNYYDPIYYGPSYYDYYQVTQGALAVDMLNLKDAVNENAIRPLWSGLARGTGVFNVNNGEAAITAFFDQSPYLTTNQ